MSQRRPIRVAMIGMGFMGRVHSHAWRNAGRVGSDHPRPELAVLCGRDLAAAEVAAEVLGWTSAEADWRSVVERPDVDLVDVCVPGDLHQVIALAALQAGKHVLCEKPLANTVAEAEEMTAAAEAADERGIRSMVGFNYRRAPAIALARRLIDEGRVGTVRHVRARYLQDWIADPTFPLVWRLQKERAGSGALGDLGAHLIDLAQYVVGAPIEAVCGMQATFVKERPLASSTVGLSALADLGAATGSVTVDDASVFLARFQGGALGTFEATRMAPGHKNGLYLEINGALGSLAFEFESMNELRWFDSTEPLDTSGFRRVLVTEPAHPYMDCWWPPGHVLGYDHTFVNQANDLLAAIADGTKPTPSFVEGLQVQRVLAAVELSSTNAAWVSI